MASTDMKWYGLAPKALLSGQVNFLSDTIKGMLTTVTYVPDQDTHDYQDDVTNEVSGTGYTAGGMALANKTVTYTAGTNVGKIDADDLVWSNSTIVNARVLVIYDATPGSDATRPLLFYSVFDANVSTDAGAFPLRRPARRSELARTGGSSPGSRTALSRRRRSRLLPRCLVPAQINPSRLSEIQRPCPMMRWSSNSISSNCPAATTPPSAQHRPLTASGCRRGGYARPLGR
jgi:hypothetical protein